MACPLLIISQSDYLNQVVDQNSHAEWQTVQIQISWLLQKPTDLDLHCLRMQGISRFSRTRVNLVNINVKCRNMKKVPEKKKFPLVYVAVSCLPVLEKYWFSYCHLFTHPYKSNHSMVNYPYHHFMTKTINVIKMTDVRTLWYLFGIIKLNRNCSMYQCKM